MLTKLGKAVAFLFAFGLGLAGSLALCFGGLQFWLDRTGG
jgi:hypothetical protein